MHHYQITQPDPGVFRAYDIRGRANDSLTADMVYTLGLAIGSEVIENKEKNIFIGRDGRLSGPVLVKALQQGLLDAGCDVIDCGMVTTPMLYYAVKTGIADSGVMLTASHNPASDNGLKMVIGQQTLSRTAIAGLSQRIKNRLFQQGSGCHESIDIQADYLNAVVRGVTLGKPMRVVVDCGNGVAGPIASELFKRLGCDVIPLYCDVDGHFPNHHPDPGDAENLRDLQQAVLAHQADVGIAFDGDADRIGVVSNQGDIIWPDRLMMLYAKRLLAQHPGAEIIFDVKSSCKLAELIQAEGGVPVMWQTGHSFIKSRLQQSKAILAGEMSGHIFFADRWFGFDDGLYAAARLLEIISNDTRSLAEIFNSDYPNTINTPELKITVPDTEKFSLVEAFVREADFSQGKKTTIDGLRVDFEYGWGLLRASNTSPNLTCRFEADTEEALSAIKTRFREQLKSIAPTLAIPF